MSPEVGHVASAEKGTVSIRGQVGSPSISCCRLVATFPPVCENGLRFVAPTHRRTKASGRLAQRERRTLTRSRSGVQIPHRPPLKPQAIGLFARWLFLCQGDRIQQLLCK